MKNVVGNNIVSIESNWKFSGTVAENFDEHVKLSVPYYNQGHDLICSLSDFFVNNGSHIYEIGCSTGTLLEKIGNRNLNIEKQIKITGIDIEQDMILQAKKKCADFNNINLICDDIINLELEKSDLIISYYSVQFINPRVRQLVINKIYESLNWGGAFIYFEKVRACDARFQDIISTLYMEYKLDRGYTPEEIISKQRSLKGVLEPFSTNGNLDLLKRAGFEDITTVMKYLCFEGFLAIK
ncbi:methyltransferase [Chryseobacterium sp. StRB126]|uniref:methyltransferase n=1 Tax=Chryseobacterium sp. StRB126 TaxID=878220 RepID=UPI0004E98419|nr:methyltransferase [Chryseobacterium sp. StRB126]BAP30774.1 methyltransferase [Chryseobacterium sp. StRB126]